MDYIPLSLRNEYNGDTQNISLHCNEYWYKKKVSFFKQALKKIENIKSLKGRLLDLGCGFGYFLDLARKNGWETSGVEISQFAVQRAQQELNLNIFSSRSCFLLLSILK